MDVERYRQILHLCFPQLTMSSIKFLGGGTFRVFEVNGDRTSQQALIFRFPHGGAGGGLLQRERQVCNGLGPSLPIAIPRYDYFSESCPLFDRPVAGYPRLPGVALQDCTLDGAAQGKAAEQLGGFLSTLHSLPVEGFWANLLPSPTPIQLRDRQRALYAEVQRYAFPSLSAQKRAWIETLFEPFLAEEANWQFETALVHGDLDSSNILYDPMQHSIVGILDFEETSLGDPAWDFCVLLAEYGSDFLQDMLAAYRLPLDAHFGERVAFHARRILFHELLYGIQVGAPEYADHAQERLRRAMAGLEPIGGWLAASTSETRSQEGYLA
ncbi:phosphotransferase family protein [Chloroflexota bacterium]